MEKLLIFNGGPLGALSSTFEESSNDQYSSCLADLAFSELLHNFVAS